MYIIYSTYHIFLSIYSYAWRLRREWVEAWRHRKLAEKITGGRVLSKSKKMHAIKSIMLDSSELSIDSSDLGLEIGEHYSNKWGCHESHTRALVTSKIAAHEGDDQAL